MIDIQYDIIMGGREVSRPYRVGFSPKASGFYPFDDATDLERGRRWRCGVADSSLSLKSDIPQHQRQVRSTGIVKRLFFMFLFLCPSIYPLNHFYGIAFINAARAEAFPLQPSLFFHIIICVVFTLPCRLQSRRQVSCLASRVK